MGNTNTKKTEETRSIPSSLAPKVKATKEDAPSTCNVLKEDIRTCMKNGNTPVLIVDEKEDSWQTFQELQDRDIFLMDCHFLKEETIKMNSRKSIEPKALSEKENDVFYNAEKMKSLAEENWSTQIFWFPYNSMEKEIVVKTQNMYCSLRDVFYNAEKMKSLAEENWSTQIFWFPYNSVSLFDYEPKNDDLWIRLINKAPSNVDCEDFGFYLWRRSKDKISQKSLAAVSPLLAENTELTPYLSWAAFKSLKYVLYPSGELYQELPHAIHYRTHIAETPVHDMEFIFDYKGDYNKVLEIIQVVVEKTDHNEEKDEYPLNLCLEMRFMSYSDTYLGCGNVGNPANGGSGHVFCIEIISVVGTKGWEKFSIDVGREWMALGGIPHLAKQWDYLPGIHQHIQEKMCLELKTFKEQLETSKADPRGMFLNKGLKKLFDL